MLRAQGERAARYLATMPPSIEGEGGDNALWDAALAVVRGFALGEAEGAALLLRDFNPRCRPPWDRAVVERKAREAATHSKHPEGYLRDVLARIADHPAKRLADLLPWNWMPIGTVKTEAA